MFSLPLHAVVVCKALSIATSPSVLLDTVRENRPHSIYQYSNMAPRLSGQTFIFDVVFFVSKSLLGFWPESLLRQVRIFIYRTRPIADSWGLHGKRYRCQWHALMKYTAGRSQSVHAGYTCDPFIDSPIVPHLYNNVANSKQWAI